MEMETVRVTPAILPPTMRTTPNSPMVWAKLRMAPVAIPERASGTTTRRKLLYQTRVLFSLDVGFGRERPIGIAWRGLRKTYLPVRPLAHIIAPFALGKVITFGSIGPSERSGSERRTAQELRHWP